MSKSRHAAVWHRKVNCHTRNRSNSFRRPAFLQRASNVDVTHREPSTRARIKPKRALVVCLHIDKKDEYTKQHARFEISLTVNLLKCFEINNMTVYFLRSFHIHLRITN